MVRLFRKGVAFIDSSERVVTSVKTILQKQPTVVVVGTTVAEHAPTDPYGSVHTYGCSLSSVEY